jgi:hypothetical protein
MTQNNEPPELVANYDDRPKIENHIRTFLVWTFYYFDYSVDKMPGGMILPGWF